MVMLPPVLPLTHSNTLEPLILQVERVMGIEPTYDAWEAPALPLSYTRATMRDQECSEGIDCQRRRCYSSVRDK